MLCACACLAFPALADNVLQPPQDFIAAAYNGTPPEPQSIWLTGPLKDTARDILGRTPPARIRYWKNGARSVWVLEQIGKYKPITTGIIIDDGAITQLKVLVYRESHGWEVKYPFFTNQFIGAKLEDMKDHTLTKHIDGIAGATLSVRALVKLARLALTLDHEATHGTP